MSKTVHPYSHRLVILRDWKSRWFATGRQYATLLRGDVLLREYLAKKLRGFYISSLDIERSPKTTRIIIRTSRPGMLIGRQGEGAQKLREDITKFFKKKAIKVPEDLKLDIVEVTSPDSDAHIIAYSVAEGLEKRLPFRRVLKTTIEKVMAVRGVEGVRVVLGGRLGGAEIARTEQAKKGSIPLQTFRADVDFAREKAHLPYGDIGIKVWIYRGEIFNDKPIQK
ncbi:MAG: 30S ribosomal protein S3 [Candidatus Pacebacteria bacterium]|nr:30S ribosomal protein S3 [Candidatus Paceibacterota bacterium]MBP9780838.1 30S ribosomal protein S3 [Candidatus Paceibacterota bacterium]MDQ5949862.1 small subunit ribosomal protein [Patescibacteria group bacterium]MDQ5962073.1 small subunit ribosomal protein [Patescibacteria group bacterium]